MCSTTWPIIIHSGYQQQQCIFTHHGRVRTKIEYALFLIESSTTKESSSAHIPRCVYVRTQASTESGLLACDRYSHFHQRVKNDRSSFGSNKKIREERDPFSRDEMTASTSSTKTSIFVRSSPNLCSDGERFCSSCKILRNPEFGRNLVPLVRNGLLLVLMMCSGPSSQKRIGLTINLSKELKEGRETSSKCVLQA